MRAIILNPPAMRDRLFPLTAPLGTALAAAALQQAGCEVAVLDLAAQRLSFGAVKAWVRGQGYDLLYAAGDNEQAEYLRWFTGLTTLAPDPAPCLLGGKAAASLGPALLQWSLAAAIVRAEPEIVLAQAAAALQAGRPLAQAPGLLLRGPDGAVETPPLPPRPDLAGLPAPAWQLLPVKAYLSRRYRRGDRQVTAALPVLLSRGGPAPGAHTVDDEGPTARCRPLPEVAAELDELTARWQVRHVMFRGLAVPQDDGFVEQLAALLAARPQLTWELRARIDLLSPARLRQLAEAGCCFVEYLPEVLDEPGLAMVGRQLSLDQVASLLQAHRDLKVPFALRRLICGEAKPAPLPPALAPLLPGDADAAPALVRYYPGTALYERVQAQAAPGAEDDFEACAVSPRTPPADRPTPVLDPLQQADRRRRANHFPRVATRPPALGPAPRIAVIGAARPSSVIRALARLENEYPRAHVVVAVSPALRAQLSWLDPARYTLLGYDETGKLGLVRRLRGHRPQLVVLATDETSGRYGRAACLAVLTGCRRTLVYDDVSGELAGFHREISATWRSKRAPDSSAGDDDLAAGTASPLDRPQGRLFLPELSSSSMRAARLAPYRFAAGLVMPGERVLDVECGAGYGSALLAAAGGRVTAADPSPTAVDYAAARYAGCGIAFQQAAGLPFESAAFDALVWATPSPLELTAERLAELRRLLVPGGLALIAVAAEPPRRMPCTEWWAQARRQAEDLLRPYLQVRDVVPQLDGVVDWRLPYGDRMLLLAEKEPALTSPHPRWARHRPLISVVMCTWNVMPYVREAVGSILDQSLRDFEFIVVDNGSTDGTREWLAEHHAAGRLQLVSLPRNMGISPAVNIALSLSRGRFIARMDGDDRSRPLRFEHEAAYLLAHPEVYVVGSDAAIIDTDGQETGETYPTIHAWPEIRAIIEQRCPIPNGTVMFRRELLRDVGLYDVDNAGGCEDYDLWLRVVERYPIVLLDEVLYDYRQHGRQITGQRRHHTWVTAVRRLRRGC